MCVISILWIAPGKPTIAITGVGPTWFNVKYAPSQQGVSGSMFYVQYKKTSRSNWDQSKEESVLRTLQVTGLKPAVYYEVRVVAKNGASLETPSETVVVYTDPSGAIEFTFICVLCHPKNSRIDQNFCTSYNQNSMKICFPPFEAMLILNSKVGTMPRKFEVFSLNKPTRKISVDAKNRVSFARA